jgi:hypothetical protein
MRQLNPIHEQITTSKEYQIRLKAARKCDERPSPNLLEGRMRDVAEDFSCALIRV